MQTKRFLPKKKVNLLLPQPEEDAPPHIYEEELLFCDLVKAGNAAALQQFEHIRNLRAVDYLSKDPLRNEQYNFAILAALLARACIGGGMSQDEAYRLSDIYIRRADAGAAANEVATLAAEMTVEFTRRMGQRQKAAYSRVVQRCVDYIHTHLYTHITVRLLGTQVGRSASYLSTLFKRETGYAPSDYICRKRIELSRSLLLHSEYTSQEVGDCLLFSSNSHFIKMFKKYTGCTPKQYREGHLCSYTAYPAPPAKRPAKELELHPSDSRDS